ncbi:MAG: hypothetical protein H6702_18375 [Myxococcales bacterium]|nr:hypothetical protein [Myxococcales bacterium]
MPRAPASDPIALIDLDGTLADYDAALRRDLRPLCAPGELATLDGADSLHDLEQVGPHWHARMQVVMRQPGWWRELAPITANFEVVALFRELGFDLHVLTKGPWSKARAWMEKVEWCQRHIPDAEVHITGAREGKGLVYGKVLFDDYPPYVESWLKWRPRGLAILPAHPWNADFQHPNAVRWDGSAAVRAELVRRLTALRASAR